MPYTEVRVATATLFNVARHELTVKCPSKRAPNGGYQRISIKSEDSLAIKVPNLERDPLLRRDHSLSL